MNIGPVNVITYEFLNQEFVMNYVPRLYFFSILRLERSFSTLVDLVGKNLTVH